MSSAVKVLNKTAVKEGKRYYGASLTRSQGLVIDRDDELAKAVFNADELSFYADGDHALWFDLPKRKFVFSGDLDAATGTFAGALQAAKGTFSGQLKAASGTFAGNLQAAGGTFKGALQAASGTFTGKLEAPLVHLPARYKPPVALSQVS
ncbi:hypothetical protein CDO73_03600 [Saccharibacillus sp. O23]|nr:hypothetical protein CDO73_03600 [Saccharibacillus sp. O23]